MHGVYCQEKCIAKMIFVKRCHVSHSDFRFIYCIEIWAENLENLSHKVQCRRSFAKMCCWTEKVPYQLIPDKIKQWWACGCCVFLLSHWKLLAYCLESIQTICTHIAGRKAKGCGVKLALCEEFQAVCGLIYLFADDTVRYFSWSSWRALNG